MVAALTPWDIASACFCATSVRSLLHVVHLPFFSHLIRWAAFGEIGDDDGSRAGDFFIVRRGLDGNGGGGEGGAGRLNARLVPSAANDSPAAGDDTAFVSQLRQAVAEDEWGFGFDVDPAAVPTRYISAATARSVLAVGRAVRLLGAVGGPTGGSAPPLQELLARPPQPHLHAGGGSGSSKQGGGGMPPSEWLGRAGRLGADGDDVDSDDDDDDGAQSAGEDAAGAGDDGGGDPAQLGERDRLAIAQVLMSLRSAPMFDALAFEVVVDRLRLAVYRRLWHLLTTTGGLVRHVQGLRDYLLCGRGDLFQAFLEAAAPVMAAVPATAPHAVEVLTRGPWRAALEAARPRAPSPPAPLQQLPVHRTAVAPQLTRGWGGSSSHSIILLREGGAAGAAALSARDGGKQQHIQPLAGDYAASEGTSDELDPFLRHCSLHVPPRAQVWCAPAQLMAGGSAIASAPTAADVLRWWCPATGLPQESVLRPVRVGVPLIVLGAAGSVPLLATVRAGSSSSRTAAAPDAVPTPHHFLAHSHARGDASQLSDSQAAAAVAEGSGGSDGGASSAAGAVWLPSAVSVVNGFLVRASTRLHMPQPAEERTPPPTSSPDSQVTPTAPSPYAHTASFAIVLQRSRLLVCGEAGAPATGAASAGPPSAGFVGIPESLVVQVLCKRLAAPSHSAATSTTSAPFRIVAAAYGPPSASRGSSGGIGGGEPHDVDGRPLLASGAALEHTLVREMVTGGGGGRDPLCDTFPLHVAVEYVAPTPSGAGELRVVIAGSSAADGSRTSSSGGGGNTSSTGGIVLFSVPLRLESAVPFAGWSGPGRGRAWVGLTAATSSAPSHPSRQHALGSPSVSLSAVDVLSYTEGADGYRGLALCYAPPWPLHVLLDAPVLSVYTDIARFLLRCKALSLALQSLWKALGEAPHPPHLAASASTATAAAVHGVSAQLSGVAGKRVADGAARVAARLAATHALLPLFALRSHAAFVVDALVFHLQVDVISAAHAGFVAGVAASRDFGDLCRVHDAYMHGLVSGSFLGQPALLALVERCLGRVDAFVALAWLHDGGGGEALQQRFAALGATFHADCLTLCVALRDSQGGRGGAHSLLTRLCFNGYLGAWGDEGGP